MLRAVRSADHPLKISSCVMSRSGFSERAGVIFRHSGGRTTATVRLPGVRIFRDSKTSFR